MAQAITEKFTKDVQNGAQNATHAASGLLESIDLSGIKSTLEDIRSMSKRALSTSEGTIKRHPFYSVLGAAAVGAGVALLFSRPRK